MECGETVLSIRAVDQFRANGPLYGLLEHHVVPDNPGIYTHSVNIGTLSFVLMDWLGIHSFAVKALLPLAAYGLGLLYVFLTVRSLCASGLAALVTLLLFATTYWALGAFALNALRAWHMLAFFAVIFHTDGLMTGKKRVGHALGLVFGAIVAFGCGYDFWAISGATSLAFLAFRLPRMSRTRLAVCVATIAAAFALPFLLRQAQVIYALGSAYWRQDLIYSIAIKIPFASRYIEIPSLDQIDAFYRAHNVIRPPASPSNSARQIFDTLRDMVAAVTLPRWGWLTLLTFVGAFAAGILYGERRTVVGYFSLSLLVPMVIGVTVGLIAFAPFSLHVYFKHEFPLIAFPLLVAKGILLAAVIDAVFRARRNLIWAIPVVAIYLADAALVAWNNDANGHYQNFAWTQFVHRHPDAEFTLAARSLLEDADPMLGLTDGNYRFATTEEALKATTPFVVYQPYERFVDIDSSVPTCDWQDWMSHFLGPPNVRRGFNCNYGNEIPEDAEPQPSLSGFVERMPDYQVVERSDKGIGYVILQRHP